MPAAKIRIGVIGASLRQGWAGRSHLPALASHADFELAAVCTTRKETAEESANKFGARLAFSDHREMLARPDIDAIAVVVRVPSHYPPTLDAINAGKHVYTEWPLGKTQAEAVEMAALANRKGVRHMVGLQARANPWMRYMKDLVRDGYVGEVMSCRVSVVRDGILQRPSGRAWQRDDSLGANILTIPFGHTVDAFRFVAGDFSRVSAVVSTQAKQWLETDTKKLVDVTAPDNVLVAGRMRSGAVASVHVATIPWASTGFQMEVYGRDGTLVAGAAESPQLVPVRLQGAKAGSNDLKDLPLPPQYSRLPGNPPAGEARNVAEMYAGFAEAIRSGKPCEPSFDTAVELHRFIDTVRAASVQGRELEFK
jgi:predicted dehydrogenase